MLFMTLHIYPGGLPSAPLGECRLPTAEPLDGVCTRPLEHAISLCGGRGQGTSWSLLPNILSLLTGSSGDDFRHTTGILKLALKEIGQLGATWHLSQPFFSPQSLDEALKYCNYVFTIVFVFEAALKLVAFGFRRFFKDRCVVLDAGQVGATQAAGGREKALFPLGCVLAELQLLQAMATLSFPHGWPGGTSWTWPLSSCPSWALRWRRLR